MKTKLLITLSTVLLFLIPNAIFGQTLTLGSTANFVLFSSDGAVSNSGISQITGNVGTNNGSSTGFGNINGTIHDNDGVSAQSAIDLLTAYNYLNTAVQTNSISNLLGNGVTLYPGVYTVTGGASSLNGKLILDAQNDPNAKFIFKISGALSTFASSKIVLKNSAMACNIYWKIEGMVTMASGTSMKGNIIANNGAIVVGSGSSIEGRLLSTTGAVTVNSTMASTPIGCGSAFLTGPEAPNLGRVECFALFSSNGEVTNTGITTVRGDVGTNAGLTTGFNPLLVTGVIHATPDNITGQCASNLTSVYNFLNALPNDIVLLNPAQFGNGLVLTPHTYYLNSATQLTDTVFLNALGNANAVFVIKINGALNASTYSKVVLMNGAQSKNVFWKIDGAVTIDSYSTFRGTIVANNGAISFLAPGILLDGRALTTSGAVNSANMTVITPTVCITTDVDAIQPVLSIVSISPNPVNSNTKIVVNNATMAFSYQLKIYNALGIEVLNTMLTHQTTQLDTRNFSNGIYLYKVMNNNKLIQTGKLISNN